MSSILESSMFFSVLYGCTTVIGMMIGITLSSQFVTCDITTLLPKSK